MKDDESLELFSINDFAKACKTTKDTLYHYEKNGILIPTVDENNHYRYYTCLDFHRFQFISHLRNLGFSLAEIRDYQDHRSLDGYIDMLEQARVNTLAQIQSLNNRVMVSSLTKESMMAYQHCPIDLPSIFFLSESYYFMSPFCGDLASLQGIKEMSDHLEILLQKPSHTTPVVAMKVKVNENSINYQSPISFTSKTTTPELFDQSSIYYRNAGQHMHMFLNADLVTTDLKEINKGYEKMVDYARLHNYHFTTDLFCINRVNRFVTRETDEFLLELVIGVE